MGYIKYEDAREAIWRILNGMGISQKNNDRLVEEVDAVLDEYTVADALSRDEAIKMGAELAAMHGATPEQQHLRRSRRCHRGTGNEL